MKGMSRISGFSVSDDAPRYYHLQQSIRDILSTPLGSRICRREYGSLIPFLIDAPCNESTRLKLMSAAATALIRFEPRIKISQILISQQADVLAQWTLTIFAKSRDAANQAPYFTDTLSLGAAA